jgi:hypothetical protein
LTSVLQLRSETARGNQGLTTNGPEKTQMTRNLLGKSEVFQIVGCAIEVLNALRITKLRVGVILNFKRRKLQWERIAS